MENENINKPGVIFHHIMNGEYLPCYDPKYLTENNFW